MRVIKFRGFNTKNNKWLYGSHILNRGKHFVAPDEFADGKTWEDYEVEPKTIGEFTGQKCRFGDDVYEGDILRYPLSGKTYQVVFKDGIFWGEGKNGCGVSAHFFLSCDVIGNVFVNQGLIKKGGEQ